MENPELEKDGSVFMTKKEYRKYRAKEKYKANKIIILAVIYFVMLLVGIYYFMQKP
jgi:hypothetical protein